MFKPRRSGMLTARHHSGGDMRHILARPLGLGLVVVPLVASCAAPPSPGTAPSGGGSGRAAPTAAPAQRKTLTIGVQEDFANLVTPLDIVGSKALPPRF